MEIGEHLMFKHLVLIPLQLKCHRIVLIKALKLNTNNKFDKRYANSNSL